MEKGKQVSDMIDISGMLQQYRSKWYLFVISVAACLALALFWKKTHRPVYEVTANVLIDTGDNDPMSSLSLGGLFGATNYVDDEIFILSSHSLYSDVARELGLDRKRENRPGFMEKITMVENYPLDIIVPPMFADTTKTTMVFNVKVNDKGLARIKGKDHLKNEVVNLKNVPLPATFNTPYGKFTIAKTPQFVDGESYKYRFTVKGFDGAAEDLDENITALIANKRTHVIHLTYPTDDPSFGKTLLNTVMKKYDERVIGQKNQQSNKTLDFLDERIAQLSAELGDMEANIQSFKESNRIVDIKADAEYNLAVKGELAKRLVEAEGRLEIARMARDFISAPGNEYSMIPFAGGDDFAGISALIGGYNKLAMDRMQLLTNAKPDNIRVRNIEAQLDAMRGNIAKSIGKNYDNQLTIVKELRSKMNEAENLLGNIPGQERRNLDLARDQRSKQSVYLFLLGRREETQVMLANAISKGVVVDPAFVPSKPVSMGKFKLLLLALIAGMCMPVAYLYLRKLLRGKPETRQEIENQLSPGVIGEISESRAGKPLVVTANSTSSTVELFKLIRTNLMFMLKDKSKKTVMVTSTQSGEGKSFVSINLAATLALQGKKVLIVGLDIRKPMLAEYLGLPDSSVGLTSYLSRPEVSFSQVVQHVKDVEGLDVVVAGIIPPNPSELLLDPRLAEFFAQARENYDYIIVDSAPVGMVSDSLSVADFVDATIYVTRLGVTRFRDLNLINTLYEENRLPHMTVVVNGTKATSGYGYGYGSVEDHGKNKVTRKKSFFSRIFGK